MRYHGLFVACSIAPATPGFSGSRTASRPTLSLPVAQPRSPRELRRHLETPLQPSGFDFPGSFPYPLAVGEVFTGEVTRVAPFGVFVDIVEVDEKRRRVGLSVVAAGEGEARAELEAYQDKSKSGSIGTSLGNLLRSRGKSTE